MSDDRIARALEAVKEARADLEVFVRTCVGYPQYPAIARAREHHLYLAQVLLAELLKEQQQVDVKIENKSRRAWTEGEVHVMVNAALCKFVHDAGGVVTISTSDLFALAPMGTLAMSLSDDDKVLTLTRIKADS
jgi:hypothetical protein